MRRLLCRLGLHLWRVSGYWDTLEDRGTVYRCDCRAERHVTWDISGRQT
jgi:hypothetical protein